MAPAVGTRSQLELEMIPRRVPVSDNHDHVLRRRPGTPAVRVSDQAVSTSMRPVNLLLGSLCFGIYWASRVPVQKVTQVEVSCEKDFKATMELKGCTH